MIRALLSFVTIVSFTSFINAATTWQTETPMLEARSDFSTVVDQGIIYVNGGCISNQTVSSDCAEITNKFHSYNTLTRQWSELPSPKFNRTQYTAASVPLGHDTLLYYFGGYDDDSNMIYDVDVYSVVNREWTSIPNMLSSTMWRSNAPAFVIDQVIYVPGGYDPVYTSLFTMLMLNTSGRALANQTFVISNDNKPIGSGDSGAVAINGKGYVFGGFSSQIGFCFPLDTLEVFDPSASPKWSKKSTMKTARGDAGFANVAGLLFVMGGQGVLPTCSTTGDGEAIPTDDVEFYNPATDQWSYMSDLPSSRFRLSGGVGGSNGQTIYVIGGQKGEVENTTSPESDYYPVLSLVESCDVSSIVAGANEATTKSWIASIVVVVACIALL